MSTHEVKIIVDVITITVWLPFSVWLIIRTIKSIRITAKEIKKLREELKSL